MTSEEQAPVVEKITHRTEPVNIEDEMKNCFIDYAMSVIIGRAIPDVRDGLKPVHRRILYAMFHDENNTSDKAYKKSAKAVAATMGNYHPHGDAAIYDTLVKMAQPFSYRYPLVDGQGNFGSIDGDSAAAYRYTEARLTKAAESLLEDIDKETVDFVPNFDESSQEPDVLPSRIPNLLVNGTTGIAVGMATSMMPHNLGEVCDLVAAFIDKPDMPIEEMMKILPAPDFPTGGIIMGTDGVRNAYLTGQGKVVVRGVAEVEERKKNYEQIVITEIPYQVNKAVMIEKIADLVKNKQIEGISDLRDESDKDGIRVIIELKQGVQGNVILNQLYKHTPLESSFGITNLAIVEKKPVILPLSEILRHFIAHRMSVVRRRSLFDLRKAEERKHILDGLLKALDMIDEVIATIRGSPEVAAAQVALVSKFGFSEPQADAILKMQLRRLAALEQQKIIDEKNELQVIIDKLNWILASDANILSVVKDETAEIRAKYADERRTKIDYSANTDMDVLDFIEDKQVLVMLTSQNYIKRMPLDSCRQQRRGGRGVTGMTTKDEDSVDKVFLASTHDYLLCFTNRGRAYWLRVHEIPEGSRQSKGKAIVNLLNLTDEDVTAVIPLRNFESDKYLFFATKMGKVGKMSEELFSRPRSGGLIAMTILEGDELVDVMVTDGSCDVVLTTWLGQSLRFSEGEVRPTGRGVQGVKGITLRRGDAVRALTLVEKDHLLTITEGGYGKRTAFDEFRGKGRGTMGVRNIVTNLERGGVVSSLAIGDDEEIVITTAGGVVMRTQAGDISIQKRSTQGVRIIRVDEGDKVTSIAVVPADEGEEESSESPVPVDAEQQSLFSDEE
ncbi:DNA gyrase subunit A [Methanocorpusculum sp. MG]|uniref:DNA gyrase subunit A n=1 Tax=Methanocorpusculum petauri TaxID=3002863 RepID=A0ABT4IG04_9EURY|nr:DNA gyrase subunit A [Methanocorpusculum petauri]MCZ0860664.1 DNA gyrase subunit A [Methanocorpusculum petauri]MDE2443254.1 DNA gyrase subunit A [Methanocorpusculum sp.]